MQIVLVTPAPPRSRRGNRVTAVSWARTLRALGHRVRVVETFAGERCDVLVALHAKRSHDSVVRYREARPGAPLVVVLTGTDLYGDLPHDPAARESLALADRLVVLQDAAPAALPPEARGKARVIVQACKPVPRLPTARRTFDVAVVGHLRPVKEPFLTAEAARLLPPSSRIRVLHAGEALEPQMAREAARAMARSPRYRWLGGLPHGRARRLIAKSHLLALTSRMEGGAHVIGEAATAGVPIVSTAIAGTIGLLGADYPGYVPVGDAPALAALLHRAESEPALLAELERRVRAAAPRFDPRREQRAWAALLGELVRRRGSEGGA